jgi:hypothetical protein
MVGETAGKRACHARAGCPPPGLILSPGGGRDFVARPVRFAAGRRFYQ